MRVLHSVSISLVFLFSSGTKCVARKPSGSAGVMKRAWYMALLGMTSCSTQRPGITVDGEPVLKGQPTVIHNTGPATVGRAP